MGPVCSEPQRGLGRPRNKGIEQTSGKGIFFTDDDCRLLSDTLDAARRLLAAESVVGFFTGRLLRADPLDSDYGLGTLDDPADWKAGDHVDAGQMQGACMLIRRAAFEKAGPSLRRWAPAPGGVRGH